MAFPNECINMFAILMAAFIFIKIRVSEWNLETTMKVNLSLNLSNLVTLPREIVGK